MVLCSSSLNRLRHLCCPFFQSTGGGWSKIRELQSSSQMGIIYVCCLSTQTLAHPHGFFQAVSVCLALGNWMWQPSVFDFQPGAPWIYLSPHSTDPRTSPRNEKKLHLPIFWVSISCSASYLISGWWEFSLPSVDALVLYSQGCGLWLCSEQVQNSRAQ